MLAHTAYFEALASIEDETTDPEWKSILAGLVVLRLIDNWLDLGAQVVTTDITGMRAVRNAIHEVSEGDPIRAILNRLVDTLEQTEDADIRAISAHFIAYGQALQYAEQLSLAKDVFASIRDRAEVAHDNAITIEATLQIAKILKNLGNISEADELYLSIIRDAEAAGDITSSVRAQIGRTHIIMTRGDLPAAGKILEALAERTQACSLTEMYGKVLSDRAMLAFKQSDYRLAVRLSYQALEHTKDHVTRDRILANIAISFAQLGHLSASRDANLLLASTAQEQSVRCNALINLMYTAILEGHEVAFEQYRSTLAHANMSPNSEVPYRMDAGRGLLKFGRADLAAVELARARDLAERYAMNQFVFEIDAIRAEQPIPVTPAPEPQSWPADIEAIAVTIGEWRELQDAAMSHVGGAT
jgi:hypothetical protein